MCYYFFNVLSWIWLWDFWKAPHTLNPSKWYVNVQLYYWFNLKYLLSLNNLPLHFGERQANENRMGVDYGISPNLPGAAIERESFSRKPRLLCGKVELTEGMLAKQSWQSPCWGQEVLSTASRWLWSALTGQEVPYSLTGHVWVRESRWG